MTTQAVLSLALIIYLSVRSSIASRWRLRTETRANAERGLDDLRWRLHQREHEQIGERVKWTSNGP